MPSKTTVRILRNRRAPLLRSFDKGQDAWEFVDDTLVRECLSTRCVSTEGSRVTINCVGARRVRRANAGLA